MYGYDPSNRPVRQGSWRETLIFVRAAFEVVLPLMAIFIAIIGGVILSLWLLLVDVRLLVIPGALLAAGGYYLYRRDRRRQAEEAAAIDRLPH